MGLQKLFGHAVSTLNLRHSHVFVSVCRPFSSKVEYFNMGVHGALSAHLANWSFCHVVTHFSTTEVVSLLYPGTSLWGLESGLNSFRRVITILLNDKKHLSVNVFWPLCPQTVAFMASIGVFLNKAYGFLFLEKVLCYITWQYSIPWPVMHYSIWS